MTRARAVELLKGIQLCCDLDDCTNAWDCDECVEAFNVAIEALEPNLLCALADRECPFQGKEYAWCLTCPHISEEDRALVKKVALEQEPIIHCKDCKYAKPFLSRYHCKQLDEDWEITFEAEHYCSYAERMERDGE